MKKLIVVLFAFVFAVTAGCALWIHDRAYDDRRNEDRKDGRVYDQGDDNRGYHKDGKDEHRDAANSENKKRKHGDGESNGDNNEAGPGDHDNGQ
jgi:hypothetical protein